MRKKRKKTKSFVINLLLNKFKFRIQYDFFPELHNQYFFKDYFLKIILKILLTRWTLLWNFNVAEKRGKELLKSIFTEKMYYFEKYLKKKRKRKKKRNVSRLNY